MLLRPEAMSKSGQGGLRVGVNAPVCSNPSQGEKVFQGWRRVMRLISGTRFKACATPRHWFSVPIRPSVTIQQVNGVKGSGMVGHNCIGLHCKNHLHFTPRNFIPAEWYF